MGTNAAPRRARVQQQSDGLATFWVLLACIAPTAPQRQRLYESPFTDHAPHGPDTVFPEVDIDRIVGILRSVRENAVPKGGAA